MTLSDLSSIGGVVSGLAILISLVFLNIQVRQAEKNQRASVQQERAARTADIAMHLMDARFAEVHRRCMKGDPDISETELRQFMGYCRAVFLGAEDSFFQHEESLLDEMAFISFRASLRAVLTSPGIRTAWEMTRDWYGPEFGVFIDQIAAEAVAMPQMDQLTQWKVANKPLA